MFKKPLFKEFLSLTVIVGLLHFLAIKFYLYWTIKEFDSLVHFFGGALVSSFFLWLFFFSGFFEPEKRNFISFLKISLLGVVFISVSWEIFELLYGLTFVGKNEYAFDTSLDLIMDLLGGMTICLYACFIKMNHELRIMNHEEAEEVREIGEDFYI